VQIDLICALSPKIVNHQPAAHIGGSGARFSRLFPSRSVTMLMGVFKVVRQRRPPYLGG
jgi:hypothetical protein